jgi:hypothetical protein
MRLACLTLFAAALAGCNATPPDAVFLCTTSAECPPDFRCQSGLCRAPGVVSDAGAIDAGAMDAGATDAGTPDAGGTPPDGGTTVALPLVVDEAFPNRSTFGSGPPPSFALHTEDEACPTRPAGAVGDCHRIQFTGDGFSGAFWTLGGALVDAVPVRVEAGATRLTFTAWGETDGVRVRFGAGSVDADGVEDRRSVLLSATPTEYTVLLPLFDGYSEVVTPFFFSAGGGAATFYIDDIQWVDAGDGLQELPMVVDDVFPDRSGFGERGPATHTETTSCPSRPAGAVGDCHAISWAGGEAFTGALWSIGFDFTDLEARAVAAGARGLAFTAWGAMGGETIEFGAGSDDFGLAVDRQFVTLTGTPTEYFVPFTERDDVDGTHGLIGRYSNVFAGFVFAMTADQLPSGGTFYVDDIRWVAEPP